MTRKRHIKEQLVAVLKDAQAGVSVQDLCREHGIGSIEAGDRSVKVTIHFRGSETL